MLRPPRLLFIFAASCLTLFAHSVSAQPGWDDEGDSASGGGSSESSSSSDDASSGTSSEGGGSSDDFADPTAGATGGAGPASSGDPDADFGEVRDEELD